MILGIAVGLFAVGIAILGIGVRTNRPRPVLAAPPGEADDGAAPPPVPIPWTRRVGLDPEEVDQASLLRAVDDLSRLADLWAIGVLTQALEEETDPALRARVLAALRQAAAAIPGEQGHAAARAAFEQVLRSPEPEERSLAVEALGDLGALEPLEQALRDPCLPVAQTAAFTLLSKGAKEQVMRCLADAEPERSEALQTVLDAVELR